MPRYRVRPGQQHSVRTGGKSRGVRTYTAGEEFDLDPGRAAAFPDKLELVGDTPEEAHAEEVKHERAEEATPILRKRKEGGLYDIINKATNKPINDEPLTLADANEILQAAKGVDVNKEEEAPPAKASTMPKVKKEPIGASDEVETKGPDDEDK